MSATRDGITRRRLLAGAGAAALGTAGLRAGAVPAPADWDLETDVLVVGSGLGGATAAFVARVNGDAVVLVEKAPFFGGTSMKTAAVIWVPNNFVLRERGIEDRKDDCLRYLARYSYPERYDPGDAALGLDAPAYALLEAFYDHAAPAADLLKAQGALQLVEWRMFDLDRPATDYLDHAPENKVPAGRTLGVRIGDGRTGLGGDMMQQIEQALRARGARILLDHRAARLVLDGGRVIGLQALHEGRAVHLRARKAVVFASGGFAHSPELIASHQPMPIYGSCAMPAATGDLIAIAGAAGARFANMRSAWRTQIVFELAMQSRALGGGVFYPPGDSMLQVNRHGVRVVNENRNYNDRTQVHGIYDPSRAEYPNQLLFMVYDQRTAEAFAGVHPLPATPTGADYVVKGESLADLADALAARLRALAPHTGGFELASGFTEQLAATVSRYNGFARAGQDEDFARGSAGYDREWFLVFSPMRTDTRWPRNAGPNPTMHPLRDTGPYYAIILGPGALDTSGGPVIDAQARILDTRGRPIPGLYGTGNCIASPSRGAYWGAGCPLGLSMTFGYIAANAAHREPVLAPAASDEGSA